MAPSSDSPEPMMPPPTGGSESNEVSYTNASYKTKDIIDKKTAPPSNDYYRLMWNNYIYGDTNNIRTLNASKTSIMMNNAVYKYNTSSNEYKLFLDYFYGTIDSVYPPNKNAASVEDIFTDTPLELTYTNSYDLYSFTIGLETVTTINYLTVNYTAYPTAKMVGIINNPV